MLFKLGETLLSSNGGDGSSDKDTACSDDSFVLNVDSDADLEKRVDGIVFFIINVDYQILRGTVSIYAKIE